MFVNPSPVTERDVDHTVGIVDHLSSISLSAEIRTLQYADVTPGICHKSTDPLDSVQIFLQ